MNSLIILKRKDNGHQISSVMIRSEEDRKRVNSDMNQLAEDLKKKGVECIVEELKPIHG